MIIPGSGNLLTADVDALVNTVNTVGVMGKGIALQFRRAFPSMAREYEKAAGKGEIRLGQMHVWTNDAMSGPRWIINFPTKGHWRAKSRLDDIRSGLEDLIAVVRALGVRSLAVPPLGCGNGGLEWHVVEPMIEEAFAALPDVEVHVYAPTGPPVASAMATGTQKPKWTPGKAALVTLLARYTEVALEASLIEVQKLMYFLQGAGEPLRLNYVKGIYGPYAENLRHSLRAVEGHYLTGFGDGSLPVTSAEPISVLPGVAEEAAAALADHPATAARIERVLNLTEGFESAYAMELLASVHWAAVNGHGAASDPLIAAQHVGTWSPRKKRMFSRSHVTIAWSRLHDQGWLSSSTA